MKYCIENKFLKVSFINYGARITSLIYNGVDVVLGYDSEEEYYNDKTYYFGATVGRVGNRIANGRFILDNREYQLNINNNENTLHGGIEGFDQKEFEVINNSKDSITFTYVSKDGEENFPGELTLYVTYTLKRNSLIISYMYSSNKNTIANIINHSYFNLNGCGNGNILNHTFKLNAPYFLPTNNKLIPLGFLESVNNTCFDFTFPKTYNEGLDFENENIKFGNGIDHCFVTNKKRYKGYVIGDLSNIKMDVYTSFPAIQIYGGNYIDNVSLKQNKKANQNAGFAFEPQHLPDAINNKLDNTVVKKNKVYKEYIKYSFKINH